uniref:ribonuclease H n=1 Tax=viral metagenome TaxID=1070528 RepID=A0A6H1ZZ87_9ZZZZ
MLEIFTDGACLNNGKPEAKASWGFVVLTKRGRDYMNNGLVEGKQSNNTGELTAILKALSFAIGSGEEDVLIYSDSRYCIDSLTIWDIEKRVKGKQKKNYNLIKKILELTEEINVSFQWVRGHNENYYNELADSLANEALK